MPGLTLPGAVADNMRPGMWLPSDTGVIPPGNSLQQQLLDDGATHIYNFDESAGTTAANSVTGGANPLTAQGTITWQQSSIIPTDPSTKGVLLSSSGYFELADTPAFETNTFSAMVIFKPSSVSGINTLFRKEGPQYSMRLVNGGLGGFVASQGGTSGGNGAPGSCVAGQSYVAHMVYEGSKGKVVWYLNGKIADHAWPMSNPNLATSAFNLYVGGSFGTGEKFQGVLGKFAWFSGVALTEQQIIDQVIAANGSGPVDSLIFQSIGEVDKYNSYQYSVQSPQYSSITEVTDPNPPTQGDTGRTVIKITADERDRGEVGTNGANGVVRAQAIAPAIIQHGKSYWQYVEYYLPADLPQGVGGFWVMTLEDDHAQQAYIGESDLFPDQGIGIGIYDTGSNGGDVINPGNIAIQRPASLGKWHKVLMHYHMSTDSAQGYVEAWHGIRPNPMTLVMAKTYRRTAQNTGAFYPKIDSYRGGLLSGWDNVSWPSQSLWFAAQRIWNGSAITDVSQVDPDA
jgi:hypothetical protein